MKTPEAAVERDLENRSGRAAREIQMMSRMASSMLLFSLLKLVQLRGPASSFVHMTTRDVVGDLRDKVARKDAPLAQILEFCAARMSGWKRLDDRGAGQATVDLVQV